MNRKSLVAAYCQAIQTVRNLEEDLITGSLSVREALERLPFLEGNQKRLDNINKGFHHPSTCLPERLDSALAELMGEIWIAL